jgi:endonuclease III
MAVLLIERAHGMRFSDFDHSRMDIKPDVHTMRVLYRLGIAPGINEGEAIAAARRLNPSYPGELDAPLWHVGRKWCASDTPLCEACPLEEVCAQVKGSG